MKKNLIFIFLILLSITVFSQENDSDIRDYRRSQMKMMSKDIAYHEYLTIFCGDLGFNASHQSLIGYLDEYMGMTEKTQDYDNDHIISIVSEKVSKGKPLQLKLDYSVSDPADDSGEFIINKVKITGSFDAVLKLFISYWGTRLQTKDLKPNEWVYNYQAPDRIGLFIVSKNNAYIEITHM
ncbi:hypothetical protein FACS1894169_00770 [Bacteroidia bacterium]|nr:hypothetical protein FACS1894169_00770 [Bacteroidia bacterium]